jgi:hypothetical protein
MLWKSKKYVKEKVEDPKFMNYSSKRCVVAEEEDDRETV